MERGLSVSCGAAQHDAEAAILSIGQEYCQLHDDTTRHLREYRYMAAAPHLGSIRLAEEHIDVLCLLMGQLKTVCCIPLNS